MNEEDKEKLIAEIRLKEIEAVDRDTTSLMFKIFFGFFAVGAFLYVQNIFSQYPSSFLFFLFLFLYFIWVQSQADRYLFDIYDGLVNAIKTNKIKEFRTHQMTAWDNFWYKKRYNQLE